LNGIINFRTSDATNTPVTQFFTEAGIFDKPKNKTGSGGIPPGYFQPLLSLICKNSVKRIFGIGGNFFIDESYRRLNDEKLGRISLKIKHFNSKIEGLIMDLA